MKAPAIQDFKKAFRDVCKIFQIALAHKVLARATITEHPSKRHTWCKSLKCLYGQQVFCGFGISITSKTVFKPKKLNSNAFFP